MSLGRPWGIFAASVMGHLKTVSWGVLGRLGASLYVSMKTGDSKNRLFKICDKFHVF